MARAAVAVLRPRWARRVIYPVAGLVLASFAAGVIALPATGYTVADRVSIFAIGVVIAAFLHRLADVRIEAREDGVRVVNIVRARDLEWPEILGVRLPHGAPWLVLDLSDGTELAAMAVQGSDGDYARGQARRFARLVHEHSRTGRDT